MTKLYQQIAFRWHHSAFYDLCIYRQSHKSFFGKSDLFFVCMLRPLSHDIYPQELEIEAAQVKEKTRLVKAILVFWFFIQATISSWNNYI